MSVILSVKLPAAVDRRLVAAARRLGRSKSALVRAAIEAYFENGIHESCLDRAKHLAGCLEGPSDLATHPRHMKNYGR